MQSKADAKPRFFYGYVIVALGFLINMVLMGTTYTFSVFFEPLSTEFGWTRAATSGAFSLYMLLHGTLYIVTGKLNDRFGPRVVLSLCALFTGIGYVMMSRIHGIWQLYFFYGVIIAIGMSGGYVPITSTVTRWFAGNKRRGLMVGLSVAGVGMGTMVFPPLATWLIAAYGWQTSYVVIGTGAFFLIMSSAQLLKRAPEQSTLPGAVAGSTDTLHQGLTLQRAVRTRQFWLLGIAYFSFGFFLQAIMVHIVIHAIGLGISPSTASIIFIAVGGSSVLARIALGNTADRFGDRYIILGCFILMALALSWLFFAKQVWALYIFAVAFGIGYGGLVSSQSPIVADLFGMRSHGVIFGVIVSIVTLGSAIGPVVSGAIFDSTGSYNGAFAVCVGFAVLGIILSLLLRPVSNGGER